MITSKQEWLITKLMKEIEALGYDGNFTELSFYADNGFNTYATSKADASKDIQTLMAYKEAITAGKTKEEAYKMSIVL